VDDGRVCGVLAVSRAFGDPEFKGPGLEHLLQRGTSVGMWTKEFASSRCARPAGWLAQCVCACVRACVGACVGVFARAQCRGNTWV
jgi:hypothetical protein